MNSILKECKWKTLGPSVQLFSLSPLLFWSLIYVVGIHFRAPQMVLVVKNTLANAGDIRSFAREDSWRRSWQSTPVFLSGEFPWTEEPGGLQSIGSHRGRHEWSNLVDTIIMIHWPLARCHHQLMSRFNPGESFRSKYCC